MKIAYCGYDFFSACLSELLAADFEVFRVFTFPCDNRNEYNQYLYDICASNKIEISTQRIDDQTILQLESEGCELLITAGYRYKIPDLSKSSIKGINIHPTLLPIGRGSWPLPWIILTKQKNSGVSIHKLSQEFDAGDLLIQKQFTLTANENLETLSAKSQLLAKSLLMTVMQDFASYWDKAQAQSNEFSYWEIPSKEQRTIDWNTSIVEIDRISRAFGKMGCFATFDKQPWLIYQLCAWLEDHDYTPGELVHKTNTEMVIAAADGLVSLLYFESNTASLMKKIM